MSVKAILFYNIWTDVALVVNINILKIDYIYPKMQSSVMNRILYSFLLLILIFSHDTLAQTRKAERAYSSFVAGEYFDAIDSFKNTYSKTKDKVLKAEMVFMVAECYRLINDPKNAEIWYKKAVKSSYAKPEAQYWFAESLKKNGKYDLAIIEYKRYKQIVPGDARADLGIRSCELSLEWLKNPEPYKVEELKDINSKDSDFSPAYGRDDFGVLYFTSSRDDATGNKTSGATGQSFTDIFESRLDKKGKWSTPLPVEVLNSEFEDGTPGFSANYKEIYFTRCEAGKRESKGCAIMYSRRTGTGWSEPENLGILADSLVAAHPSISADGLTLYFVSDMAGGFGGKDIFMVTRENAGSVWSAPKNLGPDINTKGDELFPFIRENGVLYFASDGIIGMGGLDIFKATSQPDGSWLVQNMKSPINSFADDFGIVFENGNEIGIFSSTRKGKGNDDLFSFELPPLRFNVTGLVKDEKTGLSMPGATVQLIASDGSNLQVVTGTGGDFKFALNVGVDYIFLASRKGYLNGKEKETTKGQEKSRDFMVSIVLTPIDKPIELPNIFYDFGKWDLRPESMVSLDKLVETLNDNPNVTIELMSHTDSRDTEEYNLSLSQKRAQSVVDYLIGKGIEPERLSAKGYGESSPKVVDTEISGQNPFLKTGASLTEQYINNLSSEEQKEIAHQINRRTEFKVLRTDYESPVK
jgi:peptidoglycan-associated lipoprotein